MKSRVERERDDLDGLERIVNEIKWFITSIANLPAGNQLENIPPELFLKIISEIDLSEPQNLTNLLYVSQTFSKLLATPDLWKESGYNSHEDYVEANRLNRISKEKGEAVVWAHQAMNLAGPDSKMKLLLVGEGTAGKRLEATAAAMDIMGYATEGGVQIGKHNSAPIMLFSRVEPGAGTSQVKRLRDKYEGIQNTYARSFTANGQEGGAQIALVSMDYGFDLNRFIKYALDEQMAGKLLYVVCDEPINANAVRQKLASSKYPELADRFVGVIQPEGENPQELFDSVVSQMMPSLYEKSFDCEISPMLDKLPNDLQGQVMGHLVNQGADNLAHVSKNFYGLFNQIQQQANAVHRVNNDQDNLQDVEQGDAADCSIM
ncbi:F-box-like protein [Legionella massiliensis]|uniref:F-box-like protein n=1 Tax=Legionella massiliensis TaxID=1034943 RepID=A0A078L5Q8_9GAMM|nr:F-box protein [Legionella massiliensis]CDZ79278.1 F-box-like protein [Legionella massiliensis]CEE15016.1 F-box-like protein [Legionella massiliensis]